MNQLTLPQYWWIPPCQGFQDTWHVRPSRRSGPIWQAGRLGSQNRQASQRDDQRFLSRPRPIEMWSQPSWRHWDPCHGNTQTEWYLQTGLKKKTKAMNVNSDCRLIHREFSQAQSTMSGDLRVENEEYYRNSTIWDDEIRVLTKQQIH